MLKSFLNAFLLPLAITVLANILTAPPTPVSISVPMVIVQIAR